MREQTAEASAPIEQEFLSVIREYERVIYKGMLSVRQSQCSSQ